MGKVFIFMFYSSIIKIESAKAGHVGELNGCHGDSENQRWLS